MNANGVLAAQEAWANLMKCRFAPAFAYRLANYGKPVQAEMQLLQGLRLALIQRYGKQTGPNSWTVEPSSDNYREFVVEVQPLMETEVELKPGPFTMEILLEELAKYPENTIEPGDLVLLEPFFTQPAPAEEKKED